MEPNEVTRELLKAAKEAGYAEIHIHIAVTEWRMRFAVNMYYKKPEVLQLDGYNWASGYMGMGCDYYVTNNDLTPGEYDLTEEDE